MSQNISDGYKTFKTIQSLLWAKVNENPNFIVLQASIANSIVIIYDDFSLFPLQTTTFDFRAGFDHEH